MTQPGKSYGYLSKAFEGFSRQQPIRQFEVCDNEICASELDSKAGTSHPTGKIFIIRVGSARIAENLVNQRFYFDLLCGKS